MGSFLRLAVLGLFISLVFGCSKKSEKSESKINENQIIEGPENIAYKIVSFEKKHLDQPPLLTITVSYPEFVSANSQKTRDNINQKIASHFGASDINEIETKIDKYIGLYKRFRRKKGIDSLSKHTSNFYERVLYLSPNALSLSFESNGLNSERQFERLRLFLLDPKTGKSQTLDNFLKPGYDEKLTNLGESIFRKKQGLTTDENLFKAGFLFEGNRFYLSDNSALTEDGILFYYNPGKITDNMVEGYELKIPLDSLQTLIQKKW
ncbi:hypothetical protein FUAX_14980 [Fulvitalea axinellae]|uniref:DUF3298 domain-containing protein n=1 Tax=Fulvitalea axinellae TaxID=1182444 RepID=A0AAU9CA89_9BACT|nr:hypothetical protein FUAX_14980 [Fulvitalea axinellae]